MATPKVSPKCEKEGNTMSENFLETDGNSAMNSEQDLSKKDNVNGSSAKCSVTGALTEVGVRSDTAASEPVMPVKLKTKKTIDERGDADETAEEMKDETDGSIISILFEGHDDTLAEPHRKVQLFSLNQQPGKRKGYFLKMVEDKSERSGFRVTTTGVQNDPYAVWIARLTVDPDQPKQRQILVFINEKCSKDTKTTCVLSTLKVSEADYLLTGRRLNQVPKNLADMDKSYGFFKYAKAIGSELLYLESMLTTDRNPLLVGFDATGHPLPLNKVKKYSHDHQAFFKIIPGEFID